MNRLTLLFTTLLFFFCLNFNSLGQEGINCDEAIEIENNYDDDHYFIENKAKIYFRFTGLDEAFTVNISANNPDQDIVVNEFELYEYEDCGSTILLQSVIISDSASFNNFNIDTLIEDQEYLLVIMRDNSLRKPEANFNLKLKKRITYLCPTTYNLTCGQLIQNNDFSYRKEAGPIETLAFGNIGSPPLPSVVCEWERAFGTPELKYKNTNDPYCKMWVSVPGSGEGIMQDIAITPGKYYLSFKLEQHASEPKPEFFKVDLVKNSAYLAIEPTRYRGNYNAITTGIQHVIVIPQSQIGNSNSNNEVILCFTANDFYDKIVFYPDNISGTTPNINHAIRIDKIELKEFRTLDAGADVYKPICEKATIGPGLNCLYKGVTYNWTPVEGLSNPNIANPTVKVGACQTYTLNISVPGSSCVLSDQISTYLTSIDAGPNVTIGECTTSGIIGPACTSNDLNYNWTPSNGLNFSNVANPIASPTSVTTYTLNVTDLNGNCNFSDQVTVTPSSVTSSIDYFIPNNTNIAQLKSILGVTNNSLSNKILEIEGILTIDENFTFTNCSFYMAENAKIDVINGSELNITGNGNHFIKSCEPNKFWDGIYVTGNQNNKIFLAGSTISSSPSLFQFKNSYNGIVSRQNPLITIYGLNFDRNNQVLNVIGDGNNTHFTQFDNNNIQCSSPLVNEFNNYYYPVYAIKIENTETFGIQNYISPVPFIDGSGGGLILNNSACQIIGVKFQNFNNQFTSPTGELKSETAIKIVGNNSTPKNVILSGNYFINNQTSIAVQNDTKVAINNNKINKDENNTIYNGISESIFANIAYVSNFNTGQGAGSYYHHNLINGNEIYNVGYGVKLYNSPYFYVFNNTFDMETQIGNSYSSKNNAFSVAIYANDYQSNPPVPSTPTDYLVIENNTITHSKIGIQTDFIWADINNNIITDMNNEVDPPNFCFPYTNPCPAAPAYGIRAMNHYVNINGNKVENDLSQYSGTAPNTQNKVIGISLENVTAAGYSGANLNCNKVKSTGIGLRFAGNNEGVYGSPEIFNNRIENNNIGFAMDNFADIGDVGSSNQASENLWLPSTNPEANAHDTWNFSSADPINPGTHYILASSGLITNIGHAEFGFAGMTQSTITGGNGYNCTAPARVRKPSKKQVNTTFSKSNGANGKWMRKGLVNDSAFYLSQQLLYHHLSKDTAMYNSMPWKNFKDSMKNTSLGRAMKRNNRVVATQTNFDVNVLAIENTVNKHFADSTLDTTELNQLRQIAVKCPFTDGIAVYQARRVLHQYGDDFYVNDCEISQMTKKKNGKNKSATSDEFSEALDFQLFPNPSSGEINILYKVKENEILNFELYDVLGKKHMQERLNTRNVHRIKIEEIHTGVYFYRLIKESVIIKSGKLIVE